MDTCFVLALFIHVMYVCMHACMFSHVVLNYLCMYIRMYMPRPGGPSACMHACVYVCVTHQYIWMYMQACTCMYVHAEAHVYIHVILRATPHTRSACTGGGGRG